MEGVSLKPEKPSSAHAFLETSLAHEVQPLLHYYGRGTGVFSQCPEAAFQIEKEARRQQLIESARHEELLRVFKALKDEGVPFLVLKGTALAYGLYPRPGLRPRCDTDLFVPREVLPSVFAVMERLGYAAEPLISGELVNYQRIFYREDAFGVETVLDIHWKLANPQAVADLLDFSEMNAESAEIPGLGGARGLSARHALLHACVHRAAHHHNEDLLIWLYDIRLLGLRMDETAWRDFLELARGKKALRLAAEGLDACARFLKTEYPEGIRARVSEALGMEHEPSAVFAQKNISRIGLLASDLKSLPPSSRPRLLLEMLFPSAEFMRQKYPAAPAWAFLFLYPARILKGAVKFFADAVRRRGKA